MSTNELLENAANAYNLMIIFDESGNYAQDNLVDEIILNLDKLLKVLREDIK